MFDCCFGGGGGSYSGPTTISVPRSEFVDTPYWNPSLVTDSAGEATISVKLPDNLTTWRLDARAITEGRAGQFLVGENTFDLISTRPLLIRPVTPRFLHRRRSGAAGCCRQQQHRLGGHCGCLHLGHRRAGIR